MSNIVAGVGAGAATGAAIGSVVPVVGTAIGAGAGALLGGIGGWLGDYFTNKREQKVTDQAYARQRQLIAEQNAYNTPSAQMARFQSAGLNPNLMYGQGTPGLSTQSTNVQPSKVSGYGSASQGAMAGAGQGVGVALASLQGRNVEANTSNTLSQSALNKELARTEAVKQLNIVSQTGLNAINKDFLEKTISQRIAQTGYDARTASASADIREFEALVQPQLFKLGAEKISNEILNLASGRGVNDATISRILTQNGIDAKRLNLDTLRAAASMAVENETKYLIQSQNKGQLFKNEQVLQEMEKAKRQMAWDRYVRILRTHGVAIDRDTWFSRGLTDMIFYYNAIDGQIIHRDGTPAYAPLEEPGFGTMHAKEPF